MSVRAASFRLLVYTKARKYLHKHVIFQQEVLHMLKTATISARIDPELKRNTEQVFKEPGLTTTQAITLFYKQVDLDRGLPFAVRVPNDVTINTLEDARTRRGLESLNTFGDLFDLKTWESGEDGKSYVRHMMTLVRRQASSYTASRDG